MGFVIIWLLFGICAAIVASNRGTNGCLWFGIGVLLGPIGFALAFTTGAKCPKCASQISKEAKVCPNCGLEVEHPTGPHDVVYTKSELRAINKRPVDLPKPKSWRKNYCEACDIEFDQPVITCPYCKRNIPNHSVGSRESALPVTGVKAVPLIDSAPAEATKRCPFCAERILAAAKKCRFCGEFLRS